MAGKWNWIILLNMIIVFLANWCHAQYCKKQELVRKEHIVSKTRMVLITRRGWFGRIERNWRLQAYSDKEPQWAWESRDICCLGYQRDEYNNCVPLCIIGCPENSKCESPDHCECNTGYVKDDFNRACIPHCFDGCGTNSECSGPNQCSCLSGYQKDGEKCQAICEQNKCGENSYCSMPEQCECLVGYKQVLHSADCEPICELACGDHSYCGAPNECICERGYVADSDIDANIHCKPICSVGCGHYSKCIGPDQCVCDEGYEMENGLCVPVCHEGCPMHASCVLPNDCLCEPGYTYRQIGGISPHCEPHCINDCSEYGKCVAPDKCECLPGYEMRFHENDTQSCEALCETGCTNGLCHRPGICICNPGYLMGPNNTCEPACSLGCVNGQCTEPEICSCNKGYRFEMNSVNKCEAICSSGCLNGYCVAPDVCICWQDYEPNEALMPMGSVCVPSCYGACVNATCTAPHTCTCLDGYEPREASTTTCTPKCGNCLLGDCVAPDQCLCGPGYEHDGKECRLIIETKTPSLNTEPPTTILSVAPDYLLLPSSNCSSLCDCWQENDDLRVSETPKCTKICVDAYDAPCLDLTRCRCDPQHLELRCSESGDQNTSDIADGSSEEMKSFYSCEIKSQHGRLQNSMEEHIQSMEQKSSIWRVLAWTAPLCCIIAVVLFVGLRYFHRRHSGHLLPQFANEAFEAEL